jgi:hypothetical protein
MLDEKDIVKYKAVMINKPAIYAITIAMVAAGILKIILIGVGYTVRATWLIYNCILVTLLVSLGVCMMFTGYRIRNRVHQLLYRNKATFKITLMMIFGNIGTQCTAVSLLLWMIKPSLFGKDFSSVEWLILTGMWTWFVYNFYWRAATAFFAGFFLFIYGTKLADRQVESSSDIRPKSLEPVTNSPKIELDSV